MQHAQRQTNNFDLLRLVAALMVFHSHSFLLGGLREPVLYSDAGLEFSIGTLGVMIFFIISGYLVTASYFNCDQKMETFFSFRILRIYPGFIAQFLLVMFVIGALGSGLPYMQYLGLLAENEFYFYSGLLLTIPNISYIFAHSYMPGVANASLWSLPVEGLMYIVVFCVLKLRQKTFSHSATIIVAGMFMASACDPDWMFRPATMVCLSFMMGALLQLYRAKIPMHIAGVGLCLLGIVLFANGPYYYLIFSALLPYIVIYLAVVPVFPAESRLRMKGDFSYGIYLYSWPVTQIMGQVLHYDFALMYVLSLVLSVALAILSWHLVEKRFMALKPAVRARIEKMKAGAA